jgi:uncharacterized protein DUF6878
MTDVDNGTNGAKPGREWVVPRVRRNESAAGVNAHAREAVFAALRATGVGTLTVEFDAHDGGVDSDVYAYAGGPGEGPVELPTVLLTIRQTTATLAIQAIAVCSDHLEQTNQAWTTGPGAFGNCAFDAVEKTMKLEFHKRFLASVPYELEF